jgi:hypothetical protein
MGETPNEAISLVLGADLLRESDACARTLHLSRAAYVRRALEKANVEVNRDARRVRMYRASLRVRDESTRFTEELES